MNKYKLIIRLGLEEFLYNIGKLIYLLSLMDSDAKVKDKRILDLETELAKFKEDTEATIKKMSKEMDDATANFEFKYESVKLQLEAAQIRLRELHEFGQKKAILEKELLE